MADVVAIDLGGTNIRAARIDAEGRVQARDKMPTGAQDGMPAVVRRMADLAAKVRGPQTAGIGIGTPGTPDPESGVMKSRALNVPESEGFPLCPELAQAAGLPACADNDGNLAALGEYWKGAAQGEPYVLMFTLGTGIGGGMVVRGEIYHGCGNSTEMGHITIDLNGRDCASRVQGAWEAYASAAAAGKDAREALAAAGEAGKSSSMWRLAGGELDRVDAKVLCDAAREGDALACRQLDLSCDYLAAGLGSFITALNPSCVVLGGGMALAGDVVLARVKASLARNRAYGPVLKECRLAIAKLGDDAGMMGAACMALRRTGILSA